MKMKQKLFLKGDGPLSEGFFFFFLIQMWRAKFHKKSDLREGWFVNHYCRAKHKECEGWNMSNQTLIFKHTGSDLRRCIFSNSL